MAERLDLVSANTLLQRFGLGERPEQACARSAEAHCPDQLSRVALPHTQVAQEGVAASFEARLVRIAAKCTIGAAGDRRADW